MMNIFIRYRILFLALIVVFLAVILLGVNKAKKSVTFAEIVNGVPLEMIFVEVDSFYMGSNDKDVSNFSRPVHKVLLTRNFYIAKFELPQRLWKSVMGSLPEGMNNCSNDFINDDKPVVGVSWCDIVNVFLPRLDSITQRNYRLPTEAEWEFSARGGKYTQNCKYSGSNVVDDVAWYNEIDGAAIHTVGKKRANELGLYDMTGNAWEWCMDADYNYDSIAYINPIGKDGNFRIIRGGGVSSPASYCPIYKRCKEDSSKRSKVFSFRLVLDCSEINR